MEQFDFKRRFVLKGIGAAGIGVAVAACGGGGSNGGSSGSSGGGSSGGKGVVPDPNNATHGGSAATCQSSSFQIPLVIDASVTATGIPANVPIYAYIVGLVPQADGTDNYYHYVNTMGTVGGTHSVQLMNMNDNTQPLCNGSNTVGGLTGVTGQSNYPTVWADYSIELDRTCATVVADLADFNNLPNIGTGTNAFSGRVYFSVGAPKIPFAPNATYSSGKVSGYAAPNFLTGTGSYCLFDWLEFSWTPSITNCFLDATQVDQFGFPVSYWMNGNTAGLQGVYNKPRSTIINYFKQFTAGQEFNNLVYVPTSSDVAAGAYPSTTLTGGLLRAASPTHSAPVVGGTSTYFNSPIQAAMSTWTRTPLAVTCGTSTFWGLAQSATSSVMNFYNNAQCTGSPSFTFTDINSSNVFLCSGSTAAGSADQKNTGKAILAGFNRGVITANTVHLNINTDGGTAPLYLQSAYYPQLSNNYKVQTDSQWAYAFHQFSSTTLAYGFPYDDVGSQSGSVTTNGTTSVNIQLGMFS